MSLKQYKPTTPTRRHTELLDYSVVTVSKPHKGLVKTINYRAGKNFRGKQTVRHRGGRVKRQYRLIDFKRDKFDVPAIVETIEYDPYRSSNIALLKYADGERRYILAPLKLKVGDSVLAGEKAPIKIGNTMLLKNIPASTFVHNIETTRGNGGIIGRAAGSAIQIQGFTKDYAQLKMPSGEIRLVRSDCLATIGTVGNIDSKNIKLGKAGRKRKLGFRPTVRGVAMSGGKHPHGDGQGKSGRHGPGGPAQDRWGNPVGKKTRNNKVTNKYIIQRRPNKKGRKHKKYKTIV